MITLTDVAAEKVRALVEQRAQGACGLRIGVRGGGCSGNTYYMEFCNEAAPGDEVLEANGVTLYVDLKSMVLRGGTEVDYVEGLRGAGFKFNNPNARHGCACGESFSA
jgi:iron-sulfur cluster assembly accessory protein